MVLRARSHASCRARDHWEEAASILLCEWEVTANILLRHSKVLTSIQLPPLASDSKHFAPPLESDGKHLLAANSWRLWAGRAARLPTCIASCLREAASVHRREACPPPADFLWPGAIEALRALDCRLPRASLQIAHAGDVIEGAGELHKSRDAADPSPTTFSSVLPGFRMVHARAGRPLLCWLWH